MDEDKINNLKNLPSDKEIEDWFKSRYAASDRFSFWHESEYCTFGDRVEEIKDAIKNFTK
jgi:hypothetical protein